MCVSRKLHPAILYNTAQQPEKKEGSSGLHLVESSEAFPWDIVSVNQGLRATPSTALLLVAKQYNNHVVVMPVANICAIAMPKGLWSSPVKDAIRITANSPSS
eukprot:scaffold1878_cov170-Amphora_coffeaeformis.AAC.1